MQEKKMNRLHDLKEETSICCLACTNPQVSSYPAAAVHILHAGSHAKQNNTFLDWASVVLPCLRWLPSYNVKQWLVVSSNITGMSVDWTFVACFCYL